MEYHDDNSLLSRYPLFLAIFTFINEFLNFYPSPCIIFARQHWRDIDLDLVRVIVCKSAESIKCEFLRNWLSKDDVVVVFLYLLSDTCRCSTFAGINTPQKVGVADRKVNKA